MKNVVVIMRREFAYLALTPALYCVLAALTLFYGFVFHGDLSQTKMALLQPTAYLVGLTSFFIIAIITMRSFAGESSSGTIELLMTSPLRPIEIVIGKYLGCFFFYALTLLPVVGYLAVFAYYKNIDYGTSACTLLGLLLIGAVQIAVGLFISSLTANIIAAAAGTFVANLFLFMLASPIDYGASVYSFPSYLSWWSHFKEVFARGMIDTRSLVFYISFVLLFMFLLWLRLITSGSFSVAGRKLRRGYVALAVICGIIGLNVLAYGVMTWGGFVELAGSAREFNLAGGGWILYAAGLGLLLAFFAFSFARKNTEGGSVIRAIFENWPSVLAGLAAVIIFANVSYLGTIRIPGVETYKRWDLSRNEINTLSPQIREAVSYLQKPLKLTVFLSEHADYDGVPLARRMRDLLGELSSYSPKVEVEFCDALAEKKKAELKAREMGLPIVELEKLVSVEYNGKRMGLSASNLLRQPTASESMSGRKKAIFQGEMALTIAMKRLSDRKVIRIYFTAGHGELQLRNERGRDPESSEYLAKAFGQEAYYVKPFFFDGSSSIPADCDVLVIAGAKVPFNDKAKEKLDEYLLAGGKLMLLLPSIASQGRLEGTKELLDKFGVRARNDTVFDVKNNFSGQPTQPLALLAAEAPFSTGLRQTVLVMPNTRSLSVNEERSEEKGWRLWRLVRSLKTSTRKSAKSKKIRNGAVTVGAALGRPATATTPESRVLVLGCAEMASNYYIKSEMNERFFVSAASWLAGKHYNVKIAARSYPDYRLQINEDDLLVIRWLVMFQMPVLWLISALAIWWLRKE